MGMVDVKVSGDGCGGCEGEWGWVWWMWHESSNLNSRLAQPIGKQCQPILRDLIADQTHIHMWESTYIIYWVYISTSNILILSTSPHTQYKSTHSVQVHTLSTGLYTQ